MTQQLTIVSLEPKNNPQQLGLLAGERVVIGRECPDGITVDVAGVSRAHGEFLRVRSQYVFCDLGSTNGSWVNGKKVDVNRPVVVRAGDTLQLAAAALKIGAGGGVKSEVPSLLVIRMGADSAAIGAAIETPTTSGSIVGLEEFPIPAAGVVMTLGGSQSDVEHCAEELSARVLKEDGGLTLELLSGDTTLNGLVPAAPKVPIGDNDVISLGTIRVVINIPPRLASGAAVRAGGVFGTAMPLGKDGGDVAKTSVLGADVMEPHINPEATTSVFNSDKLYGDEAGQASPLGREKQLATGDVHPGQRFGGHQELPGNSLGLSPLEVKLVLVMTFMLFASVFLLGIWWFSQNN